MLRVKCRKASTWVVVSLVLTFVLALVQLSIIQDGKRREELEKENEMREPKMIVEQRTEPGRISFYLFYKKKLFFGSFIFEYYLHNSRACA